jgi:hypothetical protein
MAVAQNGGRLRITSEGDAVSQTAPTVELDPRDVPGWAATPYETLFTLAREDTEGPQLEALRRQFEKLRPGIAALDALATKQGVDRIDSIEDAAPLLFDHRVYKSYPLSLIEKRQFGRLTQWLNRLTTHDLSAIPMDDVTSVDGWLDRLDEHGMIMTHSTGTTGKLSFFPRSRSEWDGWQASFFEGTRAASGVDRRTEALPSFYPGYRSGHTTGTKMQKIFGELSAEGEEGRHCLYEYHRSTDLLSLAARLRDAEERGELDQLEIDPKLLEERKQLIEAGRNRQQDLEHWFTKLAEEYRGQRVRITGVTADLIQLALKGREEGLKCEFAPGSVLFTSGGMKGFKEAPDDWENLLRDFFGVERLSSIYSMTECMGYPPLCTAGYYHFFPYTITLLLDPDGNVLPREGVQTGRFAFFDLLAQSYWGGFITGDRITIYWDDDCECGWKGPRLDRNISRFSELEGGDDKITCAGTEQMYSEFMDYVSKI